MSGSLIQDISENLTLGYKALVPPAVQPGAPAAGQIAGLFASNREMMKTASPLRATPMRKKPTGPFTG